MSTYRFNTPPLRNGSGDLLPAGDYLYVVTDCDPEGPNPSKSGRGFTLSIKIAIQPAHQIIFAWPWAGVDASGVHRDGIAEFLLSCNRASKVGEEPVWSKVIGAKGKCRLKVDKDLNGIDRNYVHYWYTPKRVGLQESATSGYTQSEFEKARQKQSEATRGVEPEPDKIPY